MRYPAKSPHHRHVSDQHLAGEAPVTGFGGQPPCDRLQGVCELGVGAIAPLPAAEHVGIGRPAWRREAQQDQAGVVEPLEWLEVNGIVVLVPAGGG